MFYVLKNLRKGFILAIYLEQQSLYPGLELALKQRKKKEEREREREREREEEEEDKSCKHHISTNTSINDAHTNIQW